MILDNPGTLKSIGASQLESTFQLMKVIKDVGLHD